MKLEQIRQFVALAETLNFHRAAERLNMAQPPLSISLAKLEAELGVRLFDRTQRRVEITEAGAAALVDARRVLFHAEQMRLSIRESVAGLIPMSFANSRTPRPPRRSVRSFPRLSRLIDPLFH